MKKFAIIIPILFIGCSNKYNFEFNIIQNQILLNKEKNNNILHLVRHAIEESGNRKEDIIFLEELNYLIELRDSLQVYNHYEKKAYLEKHTSLITFIDTLSGTYNKYVFYNENSQNISLAYKLLDHFKKSKSENDFHFTIIQISFLEANLFEKCSQLIAIECLEKF